MALKCHHINQIFKYLDNTYTINKYLIEFIIRIIYNQRS